MKELIKPQKLAKLLREYREKNAVNGTRMSQQGLANRIGVSYSTLQRWEYAQVRISPMMYRRLIQLEVIPS